ncbi:MAG: glycogen-debranching protein [Sandaracinaceae bacterium]|nr:glycogen-debranching protein [Sandaracinaceae bacterium]
MTLLHRAALSLFAAGSALACAPPSHAGPDAAARDASARDAQPFDAGADASGADDAGPPRDPWAHGPPLGARRHADGALEVRVRSVNATRIELALFAAPLGEVERLRVPLTRAEESDRFTGVVGADALRAAGLGEPLYYGLRVWGPNWPYDAAWTPGSEAGFVVDIDADGNRMNPNKVVLDPYALELSHDPRNPMHTDASVFRSDDATRAIDSGPFAPKGIVLDVPPPAAPGPGRALRDQVVYEVHLRGLTRRDEALPEAERGTYAGARARARALAALGVTAIELLPLHETGNDQNELTGDAAGDNYWGYSTISYFAPDRRYAADRSPGGPTRELRETIRAFHDEGLEVWVDVVYNHTAEGRAAYLSFRGVDDATYYVHASDARSYLDHNGVGPDVATAQPMVADLVIDSLRYWHEILGVDGFRFDLASVLGNECTRACFRWSAGGLISRIAETFARPDDGGPGAILVAEAWGIGPGTYRVGQFPRGWAEWNDRYRDTVRRDLNRLGVEPVPLAELARRVTGSPDLFGERGPAASIDFVTAHDGFTLRDLFAYDRKVNDQPWPWGPSSGGRDEELSWSHGGDAIRQRRAARTAMALLLLSHGVPMLTGGDEFLRTQRGNNNPYNLDSPAIWLDPGGPAAEAGFHAMTRRLLAFRRAHDALRPAEHAGPSGDADGDGLAAITYYRDDGARADGAYLDAHDRHFLSWVLDADERGDHDRAIWVAYNGWSGAVLAHPPPAPPGTSWRLVADTGEAGAAFDHARDDDDAQAVAAWPYSVEGRALALFVARPEGSP